MQVYGIIEDQKSSIQIVSNTIQQKREKKIEKKNKQQQQQQINQIEAKSSRILNGRRLVNGVVVHLCDIYMFNILFAIIEYAAGYRKQPEMVANERKPLFWRFDRSCCSFVLHSSVFESIIAIYYYIYAVRMCVVLELDRLFFVNKNTLFNYTKPLNIFCQYLKRFQIYKYIDFQPVIIRQGKKTERINYFISRFNAE